MSISHKTICKSACQDKGKGENLYHHLRCQKKRRRLYGSSKGLLSPTVYSVMIGPTVSVDLKTRIGDWEVDAVVPDRGNG